MRKIIDPELIPPEVLEIAATLKEAGGEPYIVGGSIRDILLGKTPSDWDIAVDLHPEEVLAIFPDALTIGIEFWQSIRRQCRRGFFASRSGLSG